MSIYNLLDEIHKQTSKIDAISEANYIANITHKKPILSVHYFKEWVDLLSTIQYTIVNQNQKYFYLLENKLLECQESLLNACIDIYSERIMYNKTLKQLVQDTIIPYYHGRFVIAYSREISFLPLELRLYIYASLFRVEYRCETLMHLADRIALTLYKLDESFSGDIAIFISAWLKFRIIRKTESFTNCLISEHNAVKSCSETRKRILSDAEMTAEIAGQEFWYGFKGLSDRKNINDIEAARICLDLFCQYFVNSFSIIKDIHPLLHEYYRKGVATKVKRFISDEGLDQVTITSRYISYNHQTNIVNEIDSTIGINAVKTFVNSTMLSDVNKLNNYLYHNVGKSKVIPDISEIPDYVSQAEATSFIEIICDWVNFKCVSLPKFSEFILHLTTAMLNSRDWDFEIQNIVIGLLIEIDCSLWMRNKASEKDITSAIKILHYILTQKDAIKYKGTGWNVSIIIDEADPKNFVIYKSDNPDIPMYVGHFFTNRNPNYVDPVSFEEYILSYKRYECINWEQFQNNPITTKSMKRKRRKGLGRLKKERNNYIKID